MKKYFLGAALAVAMMSLPLSACAIDLQGILGKAGDAVEGVVDGLLTNDNITVEQMAGTWKSTGSAVAFQSDNLLKKAGGGAAANTIEKKLDSYYKKFGLNNATLTVTKEGKFTLKADKITLNGTVTKRSDGNFDFTFTPFGNMKLGSVKTYVTKSPSGLNVMFDASKLMSILSTLSGMVNNSTLSTMSDLLNGYDGLCVGFAFKKG